MSASYQITITHPDGATRIVPVESDRVNIGSGPSSHIRLEGADVLPNHGRALFTGRDGALFIDLAHQKAPVKWEIGTSVMLAGYTLHLGLTAPQADAPVLPLESLAEGTDATAMSRDDLPRIKPQSLPTDSEIIQRANELLETMTERSRRAAQRPPDPIDADESARLGVDSDDEDTATDEYIAPEESASTAIGWDMPAPPADEAAPDTLTVGGPDESDGDDTTHKMHDLNRPWDTSAEDEKQRTAAHPVRPPSLPEDEDLLDSEEIAAPLPSLPRRADIPPIPPVNFDDADQETLAMPPSLPEIPRRSPAPATIPEDTLPYLAEDEALDTQRYSGLSASASGAVSQYTQPKDWVYRSNLSAQLTLNPVNVAAGERVRVPLSVRNGNPFSIEVRITITGLPAEWEFWLEPRLRLFPGEIRPVDVVIQTRPAAQPVTINAVVHIADLQTPDVMLQLPLAVVLKREIDLAGRLEPARIDADQGGALCLYNHTLARIETFISGKIHSRTVDLVLPQTLFHLPSGQEVRVPLRFEVRHRPLLFATTYTFSVTAREGSRAPLDFTGRVQVRPRVSWLALLLLLILLAVIAFILLRAAALI